MTQYTVVNAHGSNTVQPAPAPPANPAPASPAAAEPQRRYEASAPGSGAPPAAEAKPFSTTQEAARAAMDRLRPLTLTDPTAHKQFKEASEHVYGNAPPPAWLSPAKPVEHRLSDPNDMSASVGSLYEPAHSAEVYRLTKGQTLPDDLATSPEAAEEVLAPYRDWLFRMKMPEGLGNELLSRVVHHARQAREQGNLNAEGKPSTFMSAKDAAELNQEVERWFQGYPGGLEAARQHADAWLFHTLGKDGYDELGKMLVRGDRVSSLVMDPWAIKALAGMARAHGLIRE